MFRVAILCLLARRVTRGRWGASTFLGGSWTACISTLKSLFALLQRSTALLISLPGQVCISRCSVLCAAILPVSLDFVNGFFSYSEGGCGRAGVSKSFTATLCAGTWYVQTGLSQRDISTCTCQNFFAAGAQEHLSGVRSLLVAGDVVTLQPPGVCPPP